MNCNDDKCRNYRMYRDNGGTMPHADYHARMDRLLKLQHEWDDYFEAHGFYTGFGQATEVERLEGILLV